MVKRRTKRSLFLILLAFLAGITACDSDFIRKLFTFKPQREAYLDRLRKADPVLAERWAESAEQALAQPNLISVPYTEQGRFIADGASAFRFEGIPGRRLRIEIENRGNRAVFADLFEADSSGLKQLEKADSARLKLDRKDIYGTTFLLRIQPVVGYTGDYTLHISDEPLLGWPLHEGAKTNIGSYWGADRDGGARSHEGIDIFAKRGSPLVAVSDGFITRVGENNLGGNVLFLKPDALPLSVYYAHLDTQLVDAGTRVRMGDTVGLVGNTGNARTTAPHVHLGIYTRQGAVNPLGFVSEARTMEVTGEQLPEPQWESLRRKTKAYTAPDRKSAAFDLQKGDSVSRTGVTSGYFRIITAGGQSGFVPLKELR